MCVSKIYAPLIGDESGTSEWVLEPILKPKIPYGDVASWGVLLPTGDILWSDERISRVSGNGEGEETGGRALNLPIRTNTTGIVEFYFTLSKTKGL